MNTWSRLVNSLGLQLPTILLITLYGAFEAGLFALTVRVLAAPIGIIVDAVSQYFEGTFARRVRDGDRGLRSMILAFTGRQAAVGTAPALIVAAFGGWLYAAVFGAQWATAGIYAQIIVVSYLAQFIVVPVSRSLVILERQLTQLCWDVSRAVITAGAVLGCALAGLDMLWCVLALTAAHLVSYVALFSLVLGAARRRESSD